MRVTLGIASEVTLKLVSSPKVADKIRVAAPLTQECADGYSGKGGVTISGVQAGSGAVASLPSVSPSWIALTGRHESYSYLASQQPMIASAIPKLTSASSLAVSTIAKLCCVASETATGSQ